MDEIGGKGSRDPRDTENVEMSYPDCHPEGTKGLTNELSEPQAFDLENQTKHWALIFSKNTIRSSSPESPLLMIFPQ